MEAKIAIELSKNHARNALYSASQALEVTYQLIKEPKVLVLAVLSLERCNIHLMNSIILWCESYQPNVQPSELDYDFEKVFTRFNYIFQTINSKNTLNKETIVLNQISQFIPTIQKIHNYAQAHLDAPIEFTRKDAYVMCDTTYHLTLLQLEELKKEYIKTKIFINEVIIPLL